MCQNCRTVEAERDELRRLLAERDRLLEKAHDDLMGQTQTVTVQGKEIGKLKRDLLPKVKDPVALELMRSLKRMLDPNGILNPGKVL